MDAPLTDLLISQFASAVLHTPTMSYRSTDSVATTVTGFATQDNPMKQAYKYTCGKCGLSYIGFLHNDCPDAKKHTLWKTALYVLKSFIYQRVSEACYTPRWMKLAHRDFATRESVMVAFPLNYLVQFAWWLNLHWSNFRHQRSWIDQALAKRNAVLEEQIFRLETIRRSRNVPWLGVRDAINMLGSKFKPVVNTGDERINKEYEEYISNAIKSVAMTGMYPDEIPTGWKK